MNKHEQEKLERMRVEEYIVEVFSSRPRPNKFCITLPELSECEDLERREVHDYFATRKWQDCRLEEDVGFHSLSWCHLMPEAFAYYLPAFLITILRDIDRADFLGEAIVNALIPPSCSNSGGISGWLKETFGNLDAEEIAAVVKFLEWVVRFHSDEFPQRRLVRAIACYRKHLESVATGDL